ncbi:MAG: bifunctional folylpolyglutamate synthase/dihydrofolate synthase [Nitrospinae bacterium]|nr:bifunctional folylpolyglutamate synthase/dihydrofolate synthase [Nitrospinota bacterium]
MTYAKAIDYLYSLERFGIKLGLENISHILNSLNNPHRKFKAIHIAGTNGKGSTAAMTASILQHAGYKTGLYTSPHLQDFRERIMINGAMIPEEEVMELTERIRCKMQDARCKKQEDQYLQPATCNLQLTFFEFTTAMAFLYFAEEMVDFAVVEVGMGGRLDATNVLNPVLSVITEIDIEHTEHLGGDIRTIAIEKGGIIKEKGTVILSSCKTEAIEAIEAICKEKHAKMYRIGSDFTAEMEHRNSIGQWFKFLNLQPSAFSLQPLCIPLLGKYQIANASTAVMAAYILTEKGFITGETAIRNGLKNVRWNGRLEIVSEKPLIILDGAHNPAAAKALAEELERIKNQESRCKGQDKNSKLILIIGILKDKDFRGIIDFLSPTANYVIIVRPKSDRSSEPEDLKNEFLKYIKDVEVIEDIPDAVSKAKGIAGRDDIICITGSFFTIGEARGYIKEMQNSKCKIQN